MLSESLSRRILIGGIGAFINSIIFIFFSDYTNQKIFVIFFYFIHSSIAILAGYLLLKRKKLGAFFLWMSFLMFIVALATPVTSYNLGGTLVNDSLFVFTVVTSFIMLPLIFVPMATIFFIFSVSSGIIAILRGSSKNKEKYLKNSKTEINNS